MTDHNSFKFKHKHRDLGQWHSCRFGKVTLTRWQVVCTFHSTGGTTLALMTTSHNPQLCCVPKTLLCTSFSATDTALQYCCTPQGCHSLLSHSPSNYPGNKSKTLAGVTAQISNKCQICVYCVTGIVGHSPGYFYRFTLKQKE